MTAFCDLHKDKTTYTKFCEDIETRRAVLAVYKESLDSSPFGMNIKTVNRIGYFENVLPIQRRRTQNESVVLVRLPGFIDICGIYDNLASTAVHFASFNTAVDEPEPEPEDGHTTDEDTINDEGEGGKPKPEPTSDLDIVGQYYPHKDENI
jgi:hypothetical protein